MIMQEIDKNELIVQKYMDTVKRMTKLNFPGIKEHEIEEALMSSINKNHKQVPVQIYNNYTKKTAEMYLIDLTNYILEKEPICCSSGVMFKKHNTAPNPLIDMIKDFMATRKIYKKEMFKYPKGSEDFEKYNLLQLLAKIDCNSIYGALGNNTCMYYNIHVAQSITMQGRTLISASTMFFEMFLSNNVKFGSLNEIISFIDNIITEKRNYKDSMLLDRNISMEQCFSKVILSIGDFRNGRIKWIPDEKDLDIIWNLMNRLSQEDINRIYYKNNLYEFMDNISMSKSLVYILEKLDGPFLDPNKVPSEIKVELESLLDIIKEYVYYGYQIIDRVDRCDNMIKNVSVISDTDSAIVSLDAWYHYVLDKVKDLPLKLNTMYTDAIEYFKTDEFGDITNYNDAIYYEDPVYDYDFFSDEVIEMERLIDPVKIIPQDNLRFSIINLMAYIVGELVNDYMVNFTKCIHSFDDSKPCLLILKNEYLFARALLTDVKKNYASIQDLQEGNNVGGILDIKGLAINKSTTNESTKKALKKILYEDILMSPEIDQVKILKKIRILEKKIFQSLQSGEKEYYKPAVIKALSNYEDPMRIQGIKASVIWNRVKDDDLEAIDLEARNTIGILKVNITESNINKIQDKYPETYEKFINLMQDKSIFKVKEVNRATMKIDNNITAIAIPVDVKTPEWIKEFIDYTTIINDNITNFPIESVGVVRLNNNNVNYSNIMKI